MSIPEYIERVNERINPYRGDIFVAAIIFLVSMASFGLGRLSIMWEEKGEIVITEPPLLETAAIGEAANFPNSSANTAAKKPVAQAYVASKQGDYYHLPFCPGAKRIKEENKIFFATKEEAERHGYKPASNCPGL